MLGLFCNRIIIMTWRSTTPDQWFHLQNYCKSQFGKIGIIECILRFIIYRDKCSQAKVTAYEWFFQSEIYTILQSEFEITFLIQKKEVVTHDLEVWKVYTQTII